MQTNESLPGGAQRRAGSEGEAKCWRLVNVGQAMLQRSQGLPGLMKTIRDSSGILSRRFSV